MPPNFISLYAIQAIKLRSTFTLALSLAVSRLYCHQHRLPSLTKLKEKNPGHSALTVGSTHLVVSHLPPREALAASLVAPQLTTIIGPVTATGPLPF